MAEAISLRIGAQVVGSDGPLGPLIALIVHPDERRVTHLAVRNGTVPETGRLVPIGEVLRASTDDVELRIDRRHFFTLERLIVPYRIEPAEYATRASTFSLGGAGESTFAVHELLPEGCIAIEGRPLVVDERSRDRQRRAMDDRSGQWRDRSRGREASPWTASGSFSTSTRP